MKSTYRHLIKILSCSLAIAAVLLCSVCVPAKAASWTSLSLEDHIDMIYYEGNIRCVRYDFGKVPLIQFRNLSTGYTSLSQSGYIRIAPVTDGEGAGFYIFPLGVLSNGGPPLSSGSSGGIAIDVSDYRNDATVTFSSSIGLNLEIAYDSYDEYLTEDISVSLQWAFTGYNSSGGYCGTHSTTTTSYDITLQDVRETYIYDLPMSLNLDLEAFSESIAYIVPVCFVTFKITKNDSDILINNLELEFKDFSLISRTDMLLSQSETLNAIENQLSDLNDTAENINSELGDLNDKADEMITGSDEMQDAADDFSGVAGDAQQNMDAALDQLDELPDVDLNDVDLTFDGLVGNGGFLQYSNFFKRLSKDTLWVSIMLIVCTFIWVSTLLYGKRG